MNNSASEDDSGAASDRDVPGREDDIIVVDAEDTGSSSSDESESRSRDGVDGGTCHICHQDLSDVLSCPEQEATTATRESAALRSELLRVEGAEEEDVQLRLTDFDLFDEQGHLVNLSAGLVEEGRLVFFTGWALNPVSTDASERVKIIRGGPIKSWWTCGFSQNERKTIGFTTAKADYYLDAPSQRSQPLMTDLIEKTLLTGLVIETVDDALKSSEDLSYDELLEALEARAPATGLEMFNAEMLINHAQFIVNQVYNFDAAGDDDETRQIMKIACLRELARMVGGVTVDAKRVAKQMLSYRHEEGRQREYGDNRSSDDGGAKSTTTPFVRSIFEGFFHGQMSKAGQKSGAGPRRCGVCANCNRPDCGKCAGCFRMAKYGGSDDRESNDMVRLS